MCLRKNKPPKPGYKEIVCPDCGKKRLRRIMAIEVSIKNSGGRCPKCAQRWVADLRRKPKLIRVCVECGREDLLPEHYWRQLRQKNICKKCYIGSFKRIKAQKEHNAQEVFN